MNIYLIFYSLFLLSKFWWKFLIHYNFITFSTLPRLAPNFTVLASLLLINETVLIILLPFSSSDSKFFS